ncbi:hypothetical protein PMAYCL1PPCAC_08332, partial [Pristionchus mayeri]
DGLCLTISVFPSNLPFLDSSNLTEGRFTQLIGYTHPHLLLTLTGAEDPMVEQVFILIYGAIKEVEIIGWGDISSNDLSLCANLLRNSIIDHFKLISTNLVETTISSIIGIASCAKEFTVHLDNEPQLDDPG